MLLVLPSPTHPAVDFLNRFEKDLQRMPLRPVSAVPGPAATRSNVEACQSMPTACQQAVVRGTAIRRRPDYTRRNRGPIRKSPVEVEGAACRPNDTGAPAPVTNAVSPFILEIHADSRRLNAAMITYQGRPVSTLVSIDSLTDLPGFDLPPRSAPLDTEGSDSTPRGSCSPIPSGRSLPSS